MKWIPLSILAILAFGSWLFSGVADAWWFKPGIAIVVLIGLLIAASATGKATVVAKDIQTIATTQPLFGILMAAVLASVYLAVGYVVYYYVTPWLQDQSGMDPRITIGIAIVAGLSALLPLLRLFKMTGIPLDPQNIKLGARGVALLVAAVIALLLFQQPNRFFGTDGKPLFMVADGENSVYFINPTSCAKGCYSPATGERLRAGTSQDASKYADQGGWIWANLFSGWFATNSGGVREHRVSLRRGESTSIVSTGDGRVTITPVDCVDIWSYRGDRRIAVQRDCHGFNTRLPDATKYKIVAAYGSTDVVWSIRR